METVAEAKSRPRPTSPVKPPRKRKRIVISCTECHRRKQKCDRASPCSNCVARNKQSLCQYENESARKAQLAEEGAAASSDDGGPFGVIKPAESDEAAQVTAFGYAKSNGNNNTTLGIFKKLETHDAQSPSLTAPFMSAMPDQSGLKEKYKSYIRQLPSKPYIEKLVATFFREVNWQYYPLDEGTFRELLKNWHNLSFQTLNKGPLELPPDLQFFPALLFQILALALQYQPPDYDPSLDSLKYAAAMSFDDLASDYSESGCQILCLLGKRNTTLVTVQAGFLRTAYLKNGGMITESWHYLSQTIRDGQEIGLHKTNSGPRRKPDEKPEDVLENLWNEQLRRRLWLVLSLWDIHMAIVLGRPTTVDCRDGKPAFPIDAPIPKNRREVAPAPRSESDPPTSLTMLLWSAELSAPLWDIFNLEKEDPNQNNFSKVEMMHKLIKQISLHCPPSFRATNPDTTWDSHPDCYWLPRCRPLFQNSAAFTIMALHRPYIFTNASSRTAALRAGLDILRAQRTFFNLLNVAQYKMHSLVLNTFDAIVLVAAIYILHPSENREDLDDTLQHFDWAMERFQVISARNPLAGGALNVLRAIYVRLKKALAKPLPQYPSSSANSVASSNQSPAIPTPESISSNGMSNIKPEYPSMHQNSISSVSTSSSTNQSNGSASSANTHYTLPTISNLTSPSLDPIPPTSAATPAAWEAFSGVPIGGAFDFSGMAPLQPMHDLLYNDLGTGGGGANGALDPNLVGAGLDGVGGWGEGGVGGSGVGGGYQFEGDFGNDSFWGFMNNYVP
ncbi:uncharacterized protein PAC_15868 [Phialocephala subalpina]|uniref:Zn(2)-C6 fungal-type domain-containing protein n=1 Tax=Phialocephala subalpina TaxID=576137 RepID=A0A1L7XLS9_9HELO|nr:uncharacterized protein PAC_15868 [Phialocephala subalpina]